MGSDWLEIAFDRERGRLDIYRRDSRLPGISNSVANLTCATPGGKPHPVHFSGGKSSGCEIPLADVHGKGRQFQFSNTDHTDGLELTLLINIYDQRPFLLLRLIVANHSRSNLHVNNMNLVQADLQNGGRINFSDSRRPLDFFKVGWHDWVYSGLRHGGQRDVNSLPFMRPFTGKMLFNPGTPIAKSRGEFWGEGWGILTDQKSALLAGFVSTADQFGLLHVKCGAGQGELTLTAQADNVLLEPGEELRSEWGYLQFIDLPCDDPAKDYVEAVARQMIARVPAIPPPAQWTHWYHFFQSITEGLFIDNLHTIDKIRDTIPFKIVQLDDGYQSAWGDWTTCNAKFPNDLSHLSQRIKEKGYTSGLWLAPFVVDPRSRTAREHPDWLVKDKNGKPIVSGYFYDFYGHALDLTQPAVHDHIRSLLDTIAHKWGFGFVKTDFVYAGGLPGIRQDPKMTRAQAFRKGMEAIRKGIGDETFLLGCGCPFGPAIGIVDAMRIGPDTAPNWTPYLWTVKWATPIIKGELSIGALRNNIRHTLNLSALHGRWWWNDPDCVMVRDYDTTLNNDEVLSNLSLVGLSGGLMISSDDLTRLSPERQRLVGLLTPLLNQKGQPLDILEREMAELYISPVSKQWGEWHDVAVFNWEDRAAGRKLDTLRLGYSAGEKIHIFDFWQQKYWTAPAGEIALDKIPAHGCRLLRICRAENKPVLVGDTLHITQGCEIDRWTVQSKMLQIETIDLGRKAKGALWLWLPGKLVAAESGSRQLTVEKVNGDVYRLELEFHGKADISITWEVRIRHIFRLHAVSTGRAAGDRPANHTHYGRVQNQPGADGPGLLGRIDRGSHTISCMGLPV